ncbi:hypothetical protein CC2G_014054 [Coprinopsis cinerea AmutBmut pab1-1]|nr:hypothetical protein CC2G_014054 [Coprinopsis cinerea AmutBmut pab1-1]
MTPIQAYQASLAGGIECVNRLSGHDRRHLLFRSEPVGKVSIACNNPLVAHACSSWLGMDLPQGSSNPEPMV